MLNPKVHIEADSNQVYQPAHYSARRANTDKNETKLTTIEIKPGNLYSSLNCNRIALKCLKVVDNQLPDSVFLMAAASFLHWMESQLVEPIKIRKTKQYQDITFFDCIRILISHSSKEITCTVLGEDSTQSVDLMNQSLDQWFDHHGWLNPAFKQAIPLEYLKAIQQNRNVYHVFVEACWGLVQTTPLYDQLQQINLVELMGLNEEIVNTARITKDGDCFSAMDLHIIWKHYHQYQQMLIAESPLLSFYHVCNKRREIARACN